MLPRAGTCGDISTCGIPRHFRHTVMLGGIHQLEIGCKVLALLMRFTFVVEIPEVKIEALL